MKAEPSSGSRKLARIRSRDFAGSARIPHLLMDGPAESLKILIRTAIEPRV
jgi:hypothetical protein